MSEQTELQQIVKALLGMGLSPQEIAEGIDNRIGWRTIYRYKNAKTQPVNKEHINALRKFLESKQQGVSNAHR